MNNVHQAQRINLLGKEYADVTFENYKTDKYNQLNYGLCKKYVMTFDEMLENGHGLLLWGNIGTGKSFTAAAITNCLHNLGFTVFITPFIEIIPDLLETDKGERKTVTDEFRNANLVVIDDFNPELCTDFVLENFYNLIEERYQLKLPVILTTRLSLPEMQREKDSRRSQVYNIILDSCTPMQFTGYNRRKSLKHDLSDIELESARLFFDMTVPPENLREICQEYDIEAEVGATYKDLLFKTAIKKALDGDKDFAELVKEFNTLNQM